MKYYRIALGISLLATAPAHASCGLAFCTVNSNWNLQGLAVEPGFRLDMRYEYIRLDQPMSGSDKIATDQIQRHHTELRTTNRNLLATLDYTIDSSWGMTAIVPVIDAEHAHIHNHRGAQLLETWDFTRVGDVRLLGSYKRAASDLGAGTLDFYGLNFGLKMPTGARDVTNAEGVRAERSLQPGTGTIDAIIGGYASQVWPQSDSSWFVQILAQVPLQSRDDYRPGTRLTIDIGYRYEVSERAGLMLQLNSLWRGADSGSAAEPDDTGGRSFHLSPGFSYMLTKQVQWYTFLQAPLYQHVRGIQLTADWSAVTGLTVRF